MSKVAFNRSVSWPMAGLGLPLPVQQTPALRTVWECWQLWF